MLAAFNNSQIDRAPSVCWVGVMERPIETSISRLPNIVHPRKAALTHVIYHEILRRTFCQQYFASIVIELAFSMSQKNRLVLLSYSSIRQIIRI